MKTSEGLMICESALILASFLKQVSKVFTLAIKDSWQNRMKVALPNRLAVITVSMSCPPKVLLPGITIIQPRLQPEIPKLGHLVSIFGPSMTQQPVVGFFTSFSNRFGLKFLKVFDEGRELGQTLGYK